MPEITIVEYPRKRRSRLARRKKASRKRVKTRKLSAIKKDLEALQKALVIKLYGNDCYTCPAKNLQGRNCHLGHVPWPRSVLWVACTFDYRHTRIQCMLCNIHRGGMGAVALKRMEQEIGAEEVQKLKNFSDNNKGKTVPRSYFEEKIASYTKLLKEYQQE